MAEADKAVEAEEADVDAEEEEEGLGRWKTAPSLPVERTRRAVCGWALAGRGGISTMWLVLNS